jgi:hypothetical protein
MTFNIRVVCKSCGGTAFRLSRKARAGSATSLQIEGTMSHPGLGWDLNGFVLQCDVCGHKEVRVDIEQLKG